MEMTKKDLLLVFKMKPKDAIKYLKDKGVQTAEGWKQAAKVVATDAFTISKVMAIDQLVHARNLLLQYLDRQISYYDAKQQIRQDLALPKHHANLVVRQNISNAYAHGNYERAMAAKTAYPYLRPIVLIDKNTTDICKYLYKKKMAVRIDDPLLKYIYHPRHFQCRTIWKPCNDDMIRMLGLRVVSISTIPKQYLNAKGFQRLPNQGLGINLPERLQVLT